MALNKVLLIGNVGKDPDVRHLEGGASVASFSLATTERYKDRNGETKEVTEWHNIVAWRQLADLASNYIKKGTQIFVEGRIRSRSWDDPATGTKRYITEIEATGIQLLGRKEGSGNGSTNSTYIPPQSSAQSPSPVAPAQSAPANQPANDAFGGDDGSDDLPF